MEITAVLHIIAYIILLFVILATMFKIKHLEIDVEALEDLFIDVDNLQREVTELKNKKQ